MSAYLYEKHFKLHLNSFDEIVERFADKLTSFTESDALKESHWDMGEDARLREDVRFRPTPWGRWIFSDRILANNAIYQKFQDDMVYDTRLEDAIEGVATLTGSPCVFCSGDPRFVLDKDVLRLAAKELSRQPLILEPMELEKYTTHLPISTLEAVAASEPAQEWGPEAQELPVEPLGWMRVIVPGRRLNKKMFVAKIKGNSMDDGRNGLKNGAYAVFELNPALSRKYFIVLVRGVFKDPETGNYAVKKYMADQRDQDGRHRSVTLVSLNPDKEKYPDIKLSPKDDEDVTVIARFVAALTPQDFARKPKKPRKAGRRDLTSEEGKNIIANRLRRAAECIFNGKSGIGSVVTGEEKELWKSRFVCLDPEGGAICIETDPLVGLPSFAKKIIVSFGNASRTVLGSNLRGHVCRTPIEPSGKSYQWSAPGHEEMLDEDLSVLNRLGFSESAVTLFKTDTAGIGRIVAANTLTPSFDYRVLIPPVFSHLQITSGSAYSLSKDWRLWEIAVSFPVESELRELLEKLGLKVGKTTPFASWVLVTPIRYAESLQGNVYPCFSANPPPLLSIKGVKTFASGELSMFLFGEKMISQPLPPGTSWAVVFENLSPGKYIAEVLHRRTRVKSVRMPFAVEDSFPAQVDAAVAVEIGGNRKIIDGITNFRSRNLNKLGTEKLPATVECPPLWPVDPSWNTETATRLDRIHSDENGQINADLLREAFGEAARTSSLADFVLDFQELGAVNLRHRRAANPEEIREKLAEFGRERSENLKGLKGQFQVIRKVWLEPVLRFLNYSTNEVSEEMLSEAPEGATAFVLEETRRKKGVINKIASRVLVLADSDLLTDESRTKTLFKFADKLCDAVDVNRALVTDGVHWLPHNVGMSIHAEPYDLLKILSAEDKSVFENFLFNCAVGV